MKSLLRRETQWGDCCKESINGDFVEKEKLNVEFVK